MFTIISGPSGSYYGHSNFANVASSTIYALWIAATKWIFLVEYFTCSWAANLAKVFGPV
jgi:hypothetical protein